MKTTKIVSVLFASALALSACSTSAQKAAETTSAAADGLKVTTSFYPLTYLTQEIGGDHVTITDLTPPGADAHGVELSPKEVASLESSDLVFYVAKLSPAIDDAIKASGVSAINIGEHVNLLPFAELGGDPHDHDHDHAAEATGEAHDHDHDHEAEATREAHDHDHDHAAEATGEAHDHDHAGHDHGTHDPHFWTDPSRMILAADEVAAELSKLDSAHKDTYTANAEKVKSELKGLVDELKAIDAKQCRTDAFLVSHKAFSYLALESGLDQIGIAGFDPEIEPSPARIREIQQLVSEHKIDTVFGTSDGEMKTAKAIGDEAGLKVEILDPAATQRDPKMNYVDVMKHNIELLRSSMGC
ncbi:metal ABC transporter substrate-binding protein [Trueperella pecoris]|uniref:Zinc ABC transporter substrate-binding protein n=1 Tax=Trueperella pecoris TaxID=2733571 RepID=A0A7M1QWG4_9ACTO|nr:metal ABC transporter substrate-binding protein [Trueperella pecoris]QOR46380.1 zinc ABC transporter substrate-binding protein [Trueperella pecoris]